ncbi:hypothetical protein LEP1GSC193_3841 [Leptospira alstonii serovar Pingchang str. 80-412]|uniref:Uncharacterized protein n=1 Tax=Leptospira alstonii serovar Pingchang str. 80-412 TaxID=1218564 RepID=T0G568_9LEPT|nr:hypothetical protein LEP1GSC193_3841 [Leptospira alstonii serovar Pingchang str. 80-412]
MTRSNRKRKKHEHRIPYESKNHAKSEIFRFLELCKISQATLGSQRFTAFGNLALYGSREKELNLALYGSREKELNLALYGSRDRAPGMEHEEIPR